MFLNKGTDRAIRPAEGRESLLDVFAGNVEGEGGVTKLFVGVEERYYGGSAWK